MTLPQLQSFIKSNLLDVVKIALLAIIAVFSGISAIHDFFPTQQHAYIDDGYVKVDSIVTVRGKVKVSGSVDVDNVNDRVGIDIQAINGHSNVFFNNPRKGERDMYYLLPTCVW